MSKIEERLKKMGIVLPNAPRPAAIYVPALTVGNIVFTSGNDCRVNEKLLYTGKLGTDLTVEEGKIAARQVMINLLAVLKEHLGDLDRIKRIVKLLGFVSCSSDFEEQPYVINGASEFLQEVFGDKGSHTRSALGTNSLPFNTPVEIEMIVEIKE